MSTHLEWPEILVRLGLTVIAGTLVGINRGEHGRPAGLRTTLLVCLAAAVSMIQTNLLLSTAGKPSDSYVSLDLMRLPLGILTGMGFIGGGAILRKGDVTKGVTTAATLWFITIVGLCFGGGQYGLGLAALGIGMVVLSGLKRLETLLPQDHLATLTVTANFEGPREEEVREKIASCGLGVASSAVTYNKEEGRWTLCCEVRWRARPVDQAQPSIVGELSRISGVSLVKWCPQGLVCGSD